MFSPPLGKYAIWYSTVRLPVLNFAGAAHVFRPLISLFAKMILSFSRKDHQFASLRLSSSDSGRASSHPRIGWTLGDVLNTVVIGFV